jgi:outer membrane protein insertion porin family/translocation and assembly module TamA
MGMGPRARRLVLVALLAMAIGGCRSWPAQPVVAGVSIRGTEDLDQGTLLEQLATAETPLLFGVFHRVLEYSTYDPAVLAKDLERIERWCRARGYYEAKVTAARVVHTSEHHVEVHVDVTLGDPVLVRRVDPRGLAFLPPRVAGAAVSAIELREGEIFDEGRFEADKRELFRALADGGYAFAKVQAKAEVDIAAHAVDVSYAIELGPRSRFGAIVIQGLGEIPEGPVRDTLDLHSGDVYSVTELDDAKKALLGLGVFTSVEIAEDRSHPESATVPLTVKVRESKLRTVRVGGGARFDVLRLTARLQTGWEDRNFLGGLRHFGVEAKPGVTFFPTRLPTGDAPLWAPIRALPEFHFRTSLRQPSLFEARTAGFVSGEYNVYPVLYPIPSEQNPKREPVLGYHEVKTSIGAERAMFGHHLLVTPSYNWQAYFPFSYRGGASSGLDPVRVSFPELQTIFDFRDDPLQTTRGVYFSNSAQVAGYIFQGTVSDVRVRPEVRVYTRGALGKRSVFAARLGFGFLFPGDYGSTLNPSTATGAEALVNPQDPAVVRDQQKLLIRAFYSGGPSSNRGYPLRGVGPHGPIGFLVPSGQSGVNCSIATQDPAELPSGCIRPLGGLSLWELSLETRFPISGAFHGALFVDASDLTRQVATIRFDYPHLSPGVGLRYVTPVGPLRFDVGFRPLYLQWLGHRHLPDDEGRPGDDLFDLPMSIDIAIGEAF